MHEAPRLLDTVKTARTQHAAIAFGAIAMVGCAAIACATIWRASDRMPETAAVTIGVAALIGFGLFAVTAGGAALMMMNILERQRHAFAELRGREEQLQEQSALLQSTLENMGEGLSVFDRHGRLIAWNSRFANLLALPIDLANASLYDILLEQAKRGDFGTVDPVPEARARALRFHR